MESVNVGLCIFEHVQNFLYFVVESKVNINEYFSQLHNSFSPKDQALPKLPLSLDK